MRKEITDFKFEDAEFDPVPDDDILEGIQDEMDDFGSISLEQVFVMIAVQATPSRLLWRKARQRAFDSAMKSAEFYLEVFSCADHQGNQRELLFYRRMLQNLLRLP